MKASPPNKFRIKSLREKLAQRKHHTVEQIIAIVKSTAPKPPIWDEYDIAELQDGLKNELNFTHLRQRLNRTAADIRTFCQKKGWDWNPKNHQKGLPLSPSQRPPKPVFNELILRIKIIEENPKPSFLKEAKSTTKQIRIMEQWWPEESKPAQKTGNRAIAKIERMIET